MTCFRRPEVEPPVYNSRWWYRPYLNLREGYYQFLVNMDYQRLNARLDNQPVGLAGQFICPQDFGNQSMEWPG